MKKACVFCPALSLVLLRAAAGSKGPGGRSKDLAPVVNKPKILREPAQPGPTACSLRMTIQRAVESIFMPGGARRGHGELR